MTKMMKVWDKIDIGYRISLTVALVVVVITTVTYFIIKPASIDLVSKRTWCVDRVYYKNKLVGPLTLNKIIIQYSNGNTPCSENADFRENGVLFLPGLNGGPATGKWKINGDSLNIITHDYQKVFNGVYYIDVSDNNLVLTSSSTTIICHIDKTPIPELF